MNEEYFNRKIERKIFIFNINDMDLTIPCKVYCGCCCMRWKKYECSVAKEGEKIYSNFLFQNFSLSHTRLSLWMEKRIKIFFPVSYCWLKKNSPSFPTLNCRPFSFLSRFSLLLILLAFFTFNVIVVDIVVVCDSSEKKRKERESKRRGRWNSKWELHDERRGERRWEGNEKL